VRHAREFQADPAAIIDMLVTMTESVHTAMADATTALLIADRSLAVAVVARDAGVNALRDQIDAVHAWQVPVTFDMTPLFVHADELEKEAEKVLVASVSEVCGEHPTALVRARVVQGHPVAVLIRAARGADALVVGSRGHGGFVGALLGSVSQHCVQHATCPVVVIREPDPPRDDPR
jgi:nucleotide-binding universal stress UspA family protein